MPRTFQATQLELELKAALDAFETALLTPIVSGELLTWLEHCQDTWDAFSSQVDEQINHMHPQQFEEIGQQDPELLPQTESLEAEDLAIQADREILSQNFIRAVEQVPDFGADEEKAKHHLTGLIDQATAFIARVRKQNVSLQTWYIEAFNRDRGAVD